jgi:hypothetical protein
MLLLLLQQNPKDILETVYKDLDYTSGTLCDTAESPANCSDVSQWIDKGEWLTAAKRAGADKIFFVDNNPIIVFAQCGVDDREKIKTFNRIWCLARPRLLFLASPGQLTVLDLAQKPVEENDPKNWKKIKTLETIEYLSNVTSKLQQYHRDNIESGRVFGDERFGDLNNRADKALIRDLKTIRQELIKAGLSDKKVRFAHALIGRSIFIRYLEDRGILDEKYFRNVAAKQAGWTDILKVKPLGCCDFIEKPDFYPRVLTNKEFTYTLFKTLARDFNGDMFPDVETEEQVVKQKHLNLTRNLLYGDTDSQKKLFFYSYRFDIVPLELISSIYEEFYHSSTKEKDKKTKARQDGAYYTPPVLAEFVLSKVLTYDIIEKNPRVLDMACGSGIFLVEAFRRIVRYRWHRKKAPLTFDELKNILKDQIAGIEAVEEAARIAAFSLYLSMLHYLAPPAIAQHIRQGNKLPNLLASSSRSENHYNCILHANTFDLDYIESNPFWNFGKECADIIVGNPPWGAPGNKADADTKERHKKMLEWCMANNRPIGDQEPCQAFLWRALDFLKKEGKVGMLTSAGILFKQSATTQTFRKQWLSHIKLDDVFNFVHVRNFFFKGAISPFLGMFFQNIPQDSFSIRYWSARQTSSWHLTQSILFSKYDLNIIFGNDVFDDNIWKTLWLGREADKVFITQHLKNITPLKTYVDPQNGYGRGYQTYTQKNPAGILKKLRTIKELSSRYDDLTTSAPPKGVYNIGPVNAYQGLRVLVGEGISEGGNERGKLIARYIDQPLSFYRSIYGIKLSAQEENTHLLLLGILWSSLVRYYFFMTTANWGLWHHKILLSELLQLPIALDEKNPAAKEVISVVNKLRNYHPQVQNVLQPNGTSESEIIAKRRNLEAELDEAVFKLYDLDEAQRDLIRDCCEVTLPFFYQPFDSIGAMPAVDEKDSSWIEKYIRIFCRRWNAYLDANGEMRAEIHIGANGNMVAVDFYAADKNDPWNLSPQKESWGKLLDKIGQSLPHPLGTSQILLDGLVHVISNDGITVIKRNEKRFWTRSLAREDADSTLCKRMTDTMPKEGAVVNGPSCSS